MSPAVTNLESRKLLGAISLSLTDPAVPSRCREPAKARTSILSRFVNLLVQLDHREAVECRERHEEQHT